MPPATSPSDLTAVLGRQLAERKLELPMLPGVAAEVLSLCQLESTDAARISGVIHRDQTLAAHVLRAANSAAQAGVVACVSLQQSVGRLGLQRITEIAVAVAVRNELYARPAFAELFGSLWRHSVLAAFFTKEIARARRRNVEIAFLCGLLHDVGKAVLLGAAARLPQAELALADVAAALQEHHGAAGALLARQWQLPEPVVECIEHHHGYERASRHQDMAMSVCLADLVAHVVAPDALGAQPEAPTAATLRGHPVLAGLNLYPDELAALCAKADAALALAEGMQ